MIDGIVQALNSIASALRRDFSNPYKFSAYRNAAWTTPNGAFAKVTCDVELFDTNSDFSGGTYTVPKDGYYLISGGVTQGAGDRLSAYIYKNGSAIRRGSDFRTPSSVAYTSNVSDIIYLNAGDTVELYVYSGAANSGSTGQVNTYFSGALLCTD